MQAITGIDHVAITVADLDRSCAFYDRLFGITIHAEYAPTGRVLVRQIAIGGAIVSVHQAGNGVALVAREPTRGAADVCFRWSGTADGAVALLRQHGIVVVEGPTPRRAADGLPGQSVYFRDPDGNLIELLSTEPAP